MNNVYFTVGPSELYPTTNKHLQQAIIDQIPSVNHRSEHFYQIYAHTHAMLRKLLNIPSTHHILFVSSAHESMERVLRNIADKHTFHFVTGAFSTIFYNYALDYGKEPQKADFKDKTGFDMETIEIPENTELICVTQNETSTGINIPMKDIYTLKKRYPDKLIAMDVVSSIPYVNIDFSKIDITFFSVQKGFGLPAGLAVLIINDAALEKAHVIKEQTGSKGGHHGIVTLHSDSLKTQTTETPNVMNIYLLGKIAEDMYKKGLATIREETEEKAKLIYDFFDNHPNYHPITPAYYRSKTTIVIDTKGKSAKILKTMEKHNFIIGPGYGGNKDIEMRIANFPAHSIKKVKELLKILKEIS